MKIDKNLVQRTLTGVLLVGVIIGAIMWSPWSSAVLFAIVTALSVREFHHLTNGAQAVMPPAVGMVGAVLLFAAAFIYFGQDICPYNTTWHKYLILSYYALILTVIIAALFHTKGNALNNTALFMLGQVWIALPFALLCGIMLQQSWQPILLLAFFVIIWSNDTLAYITGSLLGRHRMFERISPKKSWEGFVGGAIGALAASAIFAYSSNTLLLWQWLTFAAIIVIFGTIGDLCESLFKRTLGIKDSGRAIPGHGGWLDRFDSTLLAAPAVFIFLQLI